MAESIIGIDDALTDVIGCDPGPDHCAIARVTRCRDNTLVVVAGAYPHWHELVTGVMKTTAGVVVPPDRGFVFAYEKVTSRYGACPGATTYDTCRNAGVALSWMANRGASHVFGLGTVDWRVALGGRANLSDSEVRAELTRVLGLEQEKVISGMAKTLKKVYNLDKPIGCHLRDAVGVAVGAFLMKRHGVAVDEREVWHG